ncbi:uncharacterized protein LOC117748698 isoform X2 [Cyclopterus lumpus]|uniref:uncharacterized protein LOC117748698 isoform X2 n=1 Tax=Cyclopterus lumpus TaxID=8103 RepID=UPI001486FEA0|nr:uncharacterized protein LOC117748698 isoform X2 [Cyclopterus lumpus]
MQELKYFRDGATLVISLDGLNWISKRRCSDKGMEKRNEELQPRISSGEMIQADEELQVITCILDQRGSAASPFWGNADCRSGIAARPSPSSTTPPRCCLPEEPHRSTLSSAASSLSGRPPEAPWTRVVFNARDIFSLIKNNSNIVTLQPDSVTMDRHDRLIIFCDEDLPLQRFGDICYTEDCRTSTGWHIDDNNALSAANSPNTNNANGNQLAIRDNFNNLSRLKSCPSYDPGVLSGSDPKGKKRKSVSFEDDVMVYLFDQAWSGKMTFQLWRRTAIFSVSHTLSNTHTALLCPGASFCPKAACSSPMSLSQTLSCEIKCYLHTHTCTHAHMHTYTLIQM